MNGFKSPYEVELKEILHAMLERGMTEQEILTIYLEKLQETIAEKNIQTASDNSMKKYKKTTK